VFPFALAGLSAPFPPNRTDITFDEPRVFVEPPVADMALNLMKNF
jgi:hypothetical protein